MSTGFSFRSRTYMTTKVRGQNNLGPGPALLRMLQIIVHLPQQAEFSCTRPVHRRYFINSRNDLDGSSS